MVQNEFGVQNISIMGYSMGGHGALVVGLNNPEKFKALTVFAGLTNPTKTAWTRQAFQGYLGEESDIWKKYDATELILGGKTFPQSILFHVGSKDEYLVKSILIDGFKDACAKKNQGLDLQIVDGYDHSYYFVSTFIEKHIQYHARLLAGE